MQPYVLQISILYLTGALTEMASLKNLKRLTFSSATLPVSTAFESRYGFSPTAAPLEDTSRILYLDVFKSLGTGYIWDPSLVSYLAKMSQSGGVRQTG